MNTISHENQAGQTGGRIRNSLCSVLLGIVTVAAPVALGADVGFRYNTPHHSGHSQLNAEARGRVTIYDGLKNEVIEPAFDNQFKRIDRLMFTDAEQPQPDGDVILEDDEC